MDILSKVVEKGVELRAASILAKLYALLMMGFDPFQQKPWLQSSRVKVVGEADEG